MSTSTPNSLNAMRVHVLPRGIRAHDGVADVEEDRAQRGFAHRPSVAQRTVSPRSGVGEVCPRYIGRIFTGTVGCVSFARYIERHHARGTRRGAAHAVGRSKYPDNRTRHRPRVKNARSIERKACGRRADRPTTPLPCAGRRGTRPPRSGGGDAHGAQDAVDLGPVANARGVTGEPQHVVGVLSREVRRLQPM